MSLDATEDAIVGTLKQSLVFPISFGSREYILWEGFGLCFHESLFSQFCFLFAQRQLENLGAQRAGLEDMLKEMKRKVKLFS